jgi:nucleoside-diphosphate kinase
MEYTFAIIKPDAVLSKNSGKIIDMIEQHGFDIIRMHKVNLTEEAATEFYEVHKGKPFFGEMISFICSGPAIILALGKENAVADWRKLIGATDPEKADKGTVRQLFGTSIDKNAVHGSDSVENAEKELSMFFFDESDLDEDEVSLCDEEECDEEDDCCQNNS